MACDACLDRFIQEFIETVVADAFVHKVTEGLHAFDAIVCIVTDLTVGHTRLAESGIHTHQIIVKFILIVAGMIIGASSKTVRSEIRYKTPHTNSSVRNRIGDRTIRTADSTIVTISTLQPPTNIATTTGHVRPRNRTTITSRNQLSARIAKTIVFHVAGLSVALTGSTNKGETGHAGETGDKIATGGTGDGTEIAVLV